MQLNHRRSLVPYLTRHNLANISYLNLYKPHKLGVWICRNIDDLVVVSGPEGSPSDGALWKCPNLRGGKSERLSRDIES